jgi:single stranded DNA-binding protein
MLRRQFTATVQASRAFSTSRPSLDVARMTLIGRIGNELEQRTSTNGNPYLQYSLASNNFKGETSWFKVVVFDPKAIDFMTTYLKKGDRVYIEADASMQVYESESGEKRSSLNLVQNLVNTLSSKKADGEHVEGSE